MDTSYAKFLNLKKKSDFWLEITKSLPSVCPDSCWKVCFSKSFEAHEKLWSFQQENRNLLEHSASFTREQIGDIAWSIASTYLHHHIRLNSREYLSRSFAFFEAIVHRGYFNDIKDSDKRRCVLMCHFASSLLSNKFGRAKELICQLTNPNDSLTSSQFSGHLQSNLALNNIENLLLVSHGGTIFEKGPMDCRFESNEKFSVSSFISIVCTDMILYGEFTISNVLLSGLFSHFCKNLPQLFLKNSNALGALNAISHSVSAHCQNSNSILLVHIDSPVRRGLDGQDVFYFDESNSSCDDDATLFFSDFNNCRRKVILISEKHLVLPDISYESVFVFIPFKSKFWKLNFTLLLYSIEFLIHDHFSNRLQKAKYIGKIENFTRIKSQLYLKYSKEHILPLLADIQAKYRWVIESNFGLMLLLNYLMSYFFLSWLEFKETKRHLKCPIDRILPHNFSSLYLSVYTFLDSFTGTI